MLWYACLSGTAFLMFWWDKGAAIRGGYRTAERKLFTVSLLGSWPGSYLGRHVFRHKTRKAGFGHKLAFITVTNLAALIVIALYLSRYFPP
jgi:uncharacterized membrane protein YsdA (DUF1294 family)